MGRLFQQLYQLAGDEKTRLTRMLIFEVCKSIFESMMLGAVLYLFMTIFNHLFSASPILSDHIYKVFILALISLIGKIACGYWADRQKYQASYHIGAANRLLIGDRLKQAHMGYFDQHRLGEISSGLTTVVGDLETIGIQMIITFFVGLIQTTIMAFFIFGFDQLTGFMILTILCLSLLINSFFQAQTDRVTQKLQDFKRQLSASTIEFINGIGLIKSFGHDQVITQELIDRIKATRAGFLKVEKAVTPAAFSFQLIFKIGTWLIAWVAIYRLCLGTLSPGKAVMLIIASFMVFAGFELAISMQSIRGIAVRHINSIMQLRNLAKISEGQVTQLPHGPIQLEGVSFAYQQVPIFDNLNLKLPAGTTTAIVGPSGSGKTTLCHLISRFWDVDKGCVLIGQQDVRAFKYDDFLSAFSFVFQDVYLFDDTIRNNIKFGHPTASDDEMITVAKQAQCHDFIMSLPAGYDTILQEGGSNLSGGERQRIAIARAMLKPSQIVILDEATASVDPENESKLVTALSALLKDKTVIIIAHKLSTIQKADQIVVMDAGKLEAIGTHAELMQSSATYQRFVAQRQEASTWQLSSANASKSSIVE